MPAYTFTLNGESVTVDAPEDLSLLWALRDKLGVTGPKYGCGISVCQACTSHLDGEEFNPCVTNVRDVAGRRVTTIEGLANGDTLHPVQQAWLDQDVPQCGFCQPGQIMAATALLRRTSNPTDADIDAIENVCRCGTYFRIRDAIKLAAQMVANGASLDAGSEVAAVAAASGTPATPTVAAASTAVATTAAATATGARSALAATGSQAAVAATAATLVAGALALRAADRASDDEADATV